MRKKVSSLSDLIQKLKKHNLLSDNGADMLSACCNGIPLSLFKRINRNEQLGHLSRENYSPELRKFALTLHFYSPKAYKYVHDTFQLSLPHTSTLKTRYRAINGKPGLTEESFLF